MNYGSKDYFQAIADVAEKEPRIYAGLRVKVEGGRKHKGRTGTVTRHLRSKFGSAFRYASGASLDLRIMLGRRGFVALVTPDDDKDPTPFWVACEHLMPNT